MIAVPAEIALQTFVLPAMAAADVALPASFLNVYHDPDWPPLALSGVAIAAGGALLSAGWAARMHTASALHTE